MKVYEVKSLLIFKRGEKVNTRADMVQIRSGIAHKHLRVLMYKIQYCYEYVVLKGRVSHISGNCLEK